MVKVNGSGAGGHVHYYAVVVVVVIFIFCTLLRVVYMIINIPRPVAANECRSGNNVTFLL